MMYIIKQRERKYEIFYLQIHFIHYKLNSIHLIIHVKIQSHILFYCSRIEVPIESSLIYYYQSWSPP